MGLYHIASSLFPDTSIYYHRRRHRINGPDDHDEKGGDGSSAEGKNTVGRDSGDRDRPLSRCFPHALSNANTVPHSFNTLDGQLITVTMFSGSAELRQLKELIQDTPTVSVDLLCPNIFSNFLCYEHTISYYHHLHLLPRSLIGSSKGCFSPCIIV